MPAGQGKDAERFAAAAESGTPLGAAGDADLARELEIVAMLRSRGAAFEPSPEVKARAKQRLMAVLAAEQSAQQGPRQAAQPSAAQHSVPRQAPRPAPYGEPRRDVAPPADAELTAPMGRIVEPGPRSVRDEVDPTAETARMAPVTARQQPMAAESGGTDEVADTTVEPTPLRGARAGRRARHSIANRPAGRARSAGRPGALRRRVALVGSAAMVMMLAIAGGGILASRDALPGENLYAVKRVAESAGLALTFDDASKARRHLEIAATRLSEVERLAALRTQAAPAPEVFGTAMDEFDAATDEGSRLLLAASESDGGGAAADDLHTWAAAQSARLTELRPALPAEADADSSIELLERLLGRTEDAGGAGSCDDDECASRRASETLAPESDEAEATTGATTTPDEDGSSDRSGTDEPSPTPSRTPAGEDSGLLPDLRPDGDRDGEDATTTSKNDDEGSTSTSKSESGDEGADGKNLEVPLPLLPPITLPPLLPGMPGITIG